MQRILVYGGKGALGSAIVSHFVSNPGKYWVASVDFGANDQANANCVLSKTLGSLTEQSDLLETELAKVLNGAQFDAIFCVAGGWAGGNAAADDFLKNVDICVRQSIWTSTIAAHLASKFLNESGMLVLTGAAAATGPTPGMIGYGLCKAAVHHLTKSLAAPKSGMPEGSSVVSILP